MEWGCGCDEEFDEDEEVESVSSEHSVTLQYVSLHNLKLQLGFLESLHIIVHDSPELFGLKGMLREMVKQLERREPPASPEIMDLANKIEDVTKGPGVLPWDSSTFRGVCEVLTKAFLPVTKKINELESKLDDHKVRIQELEKHGE